MRASRDSRLRINPGNTSNTVSQNVSEHTQIITWKTEMAEAIEDLKARIAELEGQSPERKQTPEPKPVAKRRVVGGIFGGESVEYEVRPFIQPQPDPEDDPATFKIGTTDRKTQYSQAIPRPSWPRPGQEATPEEIEQNTAEFGLWMRSAQTLTRYLGYYHVSVLRGIRQWDGQYGNSGVDDESAKAWSWLQGVWTAKGMDIPSDEELKALAIKKHGALEMYR
jgi:hypothetical protein